MKTLRWGLGALVLQVANITWFTLENAWHQHEVPSLSYGDLGYWTSFALVLVTGGTMLFLTCKIICGKKEN